MKYYSKPHIVDAFQWTGEPNQTEDPEWLVEKLRSGEFRIVETDDGIAMELGSEGCLVYVGDYFIRYADGVIDGASPEHIERCYSQDVLYQTLIEVTKERYRQLLDYDALHDSCHTDDDWMRLFVAFTDKWRMAKGAYDKRRRLAQLAALTLAAMEATTDVHRESGASDIGSVR